MLLYTLICMMSIAFCTSKADSTNETSGLIPCNQDWFLYEGKCYKILGDEKKLTWVEASRKCAIENGSLATVNSAKLQDFLVMFLLLRLQAHAWIGLNDRVRDTRFTWDDGSAVNYTNWDTFQPSGINKNRYQQEHCVEMRFSNNLNRIGRWNDINCEAEMHFFCQANKSENVFSQDPLFCTLEEGEGRKYLNSCYHIVTEEKSWEDAERHCKEIYSGHLVTILNEQTEMFLNYLTSDYDESFWIGIKIREHEVQMWSSGVHLIYKNYGLVGKISMPGSCFMMIGTSWDVGPCVRKLPFICEKSDKSALVLKNAPEGWQCPGQSLWKDFGGEYCYAFESNAAVSWHIANYNCVKKGGTLASIHSEAESYILHSYVKNLQHGDAVFIGLHRNLLDKNHFEWVDGSPLEYTNWHIGEPNSLREECGEIWLKQMAWNDNSCDQKRGYICSAKKVPPATPKLNTAVPNECVCTNSSNITHHNDGSAEYESTVDICASGRPTTPVAGILVCILLIMFLTGVVVYQSRKQPFCRTIHNRFNHKDSTFHSSNHISSEGILKPDEYECRL